MHFSVIDKTSFLGVSEARFSQVVILNMRVLLLIRSSKHKRISMHWLIICGVGRFPLKIFFLAMYKSKFHFTLALCPRPKMKV